MTSDTPVFNLLNGQTERFFFFVFLQALFGFREITPCPVKLYTPHDFSSTYKITTTNDIQNMAPSGPALSIVQYVGN